MKFKIDFEKLGIVKNEFRILTVERERETAVIYVEEEEEEEILGFVKEFRE